MAYYGRGDYYSGMRGDYYRGDPFLGGLLAKGLSIAGKAVGKVLGIGGAATKAAPVAAPAAGGILSTLGKIGTIAGAATGAGAVYGIAKRAFGGGEGERKRYRRMNPLNPKALRRALRRAEGFEKFANRTVNALHRGPRKFKKRIPRS